MSEVRIADQFISFSQEQPYYDLSSAYSVPSLYIVAPEEGWKVTEIEGEASDEEILRFVEEGGYLDFLSSPEEDIYRLDDGEPV